MPPPRPPPSPPPLPPPPPPPPPPSCLLPPPPPSLPPHPFLLSLSRHTLTTQFLRGLEPLLHHLRLPNLPRSAGKWHQFSCHIPGWCRVFHSVVGCAITLFFKNSTHLHLSSLQETAFSCPVSPKGPSHTTFSSTAIQIPPSRLPPRVELYWRNMV